MTLNEMFIGGKKIDRQNAWGKRVNTLENYSVIWWIKFGNKILKEFTNFTSLAHLRTVHKSPLEANNENATRLCAVLITVHIAPAARKTKMIQM